MTDEYDMDKWEFSTFEVDFSGYNRSRPQDEDFLATIDPEPDEGAPLWTPRNTAEFERLVETRVTHRMADEVAVQRIREMKLGALPHPFLLPFAQMLEREYEEQLLTVQRLWPRGGNVLLAAQAKAGKSTMVANLLRVLCDGGSFLDNLDFYTHPVPEGRTIALLDLEMNERRIRDELGAQQIQHTEKLRVAALRGQSQSFDITNDDQRTAWIRYLKEERVHTLIIDPIAPLLAQLGVDENDNFGVTTLFNLLDRVKSEAGITDMMVVHHCGHSANWRPRGASRFNDWPDAIWMLKVEGDADEQMNPDAERLMHAKGRDVGLSTPGIISMDRNKRLTFTERAGGNTIRDTAAANRTMVLVHLAAGPATSPELYERHFQTEASSADTVDNWLRDLEAQRLVRKERRPGLANIWHLVQNEE